MNKNMDANMKGYTDANMKEYMIANMNEDSQKNL